MTRSRTRWLAAAVAALLAVVGLGRPAAGADKPKVPKVLGEPRIAAQVKPGTVLIVHDETTSATLPTGVFNRALFDSLAGADPEIVGLRRRDAAAALEKGVQRYLLTDPARFFKVASTRSVTADAIFTGSGAVVSADGYVVTNAHVVAPDDDEVVDALKDDLSDEVEDDLSSVLDDIDAALFSGTMPADVDDALSDGYFDFLEENYAFGGRTRSTTVLSGAADPAEAKAKGRAAEVVELGEAYPKKDVAILKVQASNLYSLPLGDDAEAVSGTKVFAVGYPGEATFDSGAAKGSQLEPSISSGTVSARRTVEAGYQAIQHNAAIQHGSSGGPMVDESGRIIGLTTLGSSGEEQGTFYFSVPVTLVKEFLQRKNVDAGPSAATAQYVGALDAFDQKHYRQALKKLQALDRTSPGLPFVADKIAATQKKIDAGEDVSEDGFPLIPAVIAAGFLAMLLLVLAVVLVGVRKKRRASRGSAPAVAAPPGWGNQLPPPAPSPPFTPPSGEQWPPPPQQPWPAPASWPPPGGTTAPPPPGPSGGFAPPRP